MARKGQLWKDSIRDWSRSIKRFPAENRSRRNQNDLKFALPKDGCSIGVMKAWTGSSFPERQIPVTLAIHGSAMKKTLLSGL